MNVKGVLVAMIRKTSILTVILLFCVAFLQVFNQTTTCGAAALLSVRTACLLGWRYLDNSLEGISSMQISLSF
jgi:hypothetical protein